MVPTAVGVHGSVSRDRPARLAIQRGDVVDDVGAFDGAAETRLVGQIALDDLDALRTKRRRTPAIAHQRANTIAGLREMPNEMAAGEAGRRR